MFSLVLLDYLHVLPVSAEFSPCSTYLHLVQSMFCMFHLYLVGPLDVLLGSAEVAPSSPWFRWVLSMFFRCVCECEWLCVSMTKWLLVHRVFMPSPGGSR